MTGEGDDRAELFASLYNRPDPRIGMELAGRYRVVERLGRGATATVYAVERIGDQRRLAAKILRVEVSKVDEMRQRFVREAKSMALLEHPNIVQVLDFGILEDDTPFLIMELLEGRSLAEVLDAGPMTTERALELGRQILDALAYIHETGLIHRDVKPDNVFVVDGESGEIAKLVDFGIVKVVGEAARDVGGPQISRAGIAFGTPDYMSPEQATGQPIDARSDVYAAGVLLFEMLAGRLPFESGDPMELLGMHVARQPPTLAEASNTEQPPALEAIVARALAKDPADRFASAREMRDAVENRTETETAPAPATAPEPETAPASAPAPAPAPATVSATAPETAPRIGLIVAIVIAALVVLGVIALAAD